jgi:lysophospholipase L1-like esterase
VYWRLRPYHGQYINIDEQGIRRTWNASSAPAPNQVRIFMFGGSTLWGYGARDEFTIPSLVARKLSGDPRPPWVVNFGEAGYVSTQELITLMLELRKGNVPDVAVFYDGVNDAWAAFQANAPGLPQNEINRVAEFNTRERLNWRRGFVEKLGLYRFARGLTVALASGGQDTPARGRFMDPALAAAVVETYLGNVRLVNALAREYGFKTVFFWQPTIYSKQVLSPEEERWRLTGTRRPGRGAPAFAEEYRAFNEAFRHRMKTSAIEGLVDLSGVFERERGTIFIDRFHISEVGNERVADAMAPVLRTVLSRVGR